MILANEVVENFRRMEYDPVQMRPVIEVIKRAQKFTLDPLFAATADGLSTDYGSLSRAFPFCRLPYKEVWFEFAQSDRPHFSAAPIHGPAFQARPRRVGVLCTADRDDLSAWTAHLFWSMPDGHCNAAGIAMSFDMKQEMSQSVDTSPAKVRNPLLFPNLDKTMHPGWEKAAESVKITLMRHCAPELPAYGLIPLPAYLNKDDVREAILTIMDIAKSDWAGEVAYLLAIVGLLNARTVSETERVIPSVKLNKARVRRGKQPFFEHRVLHIHPLQLRRAQTSERGEAETHGQLRLHLCSGHWKVRKTGLFFWRPFWRGNPNRGMVSKDYEIEGSTKGE